MVEETISVADVTALEFTCQVPECGASMRILQHDFTLDENWKLRVTHICKHVETSMLSSGDAWTDVRRFTMVFAEIAARVNQCELGVPMKICIVAKKRESS